MKKRFQNDIGGEHVEARKRPRKRRRVSGKKELTSFPPSTTPVPIVVENVSATPQIVPDGRKAWLNCQAPALETYMAHSCMECGSDDIIEDWAQGEHVCRGCGLVLAERILDTSSEWRTFADDGGGDPSRVSAIMNPLLGNDMGTEIAFSGHCGAENAKLAVNHYENATGKQDRRLERLFLLVDEYCEKLCVRGAALKRSKEIIKGYVNLVDKAKQEGVSKGGVSSLLLESQEGDVVAACVFLACRNERIVRSFRDFEIVSKASAINIKKLISTISVALPGSKEGPSFTVAEITSYYCQKMHLPPSSCKLALNLAEVLGAYGPIMNKAPPSIASIAIFATMHRDGNGSPQSLQKIGSAMGISEQTVDRGYQLALPCLKQLLQKAMDLGKKA